MLSTRPFAWMARSAATLVAGLPQPLTTVMPSLASASPACPASSYARDPGSALPRMQTWGLRCGRGMEVSVWPSGERVNGTEASSGTG